MTRYVVVPISPSGFIMTWGHGVPASFKIWDNEEGRCVRSQYSANSDAEFATVTAVRIRLLQLTGE